MMSYYTMFSKPKRILAAKLCFFVFFTKMLISCTPIFVNILDQGTVLQVVMQLEIETAAKNTTNNEDLHEHSVKVFKPEAIDLSFYPTVENNGKQRNYLRNEKSICSFHPKVPTPPPNC